LIRELETMTPAQEPTDDTLAQELPASYRQRWEALPADEQEQLLTKALNLA